MRASLGYPDPFVLKYIEISNEDFLNGGIPSYVGMFAYMHIGLDCNSNHL
jgi:hypothetical protein